MNVPGIKINRFSAADFSLTHCFHGLVRENVPKADARLHKM